MNMYLMLSVCAGLIAGAMVWIFDRPYSSFSRLKRAYDEIRIGDRYEMDFNPFHPFEKRRIVSCEITDKILFGGKHPWVQYRFEDGSISQMELKEFLDIYTKSQLN